MKMIIIINNDYKLKIIIKKQRNIKDEMKHVT